MKSMLGSITAIIGAASISEAAVTLNQIETFPGSGTGGWISGPGNNPTPPVVVANSGPLGTGDGALLITANGGGGAGSRLVAYNESAWTGDYVGQGIVSIAASLQNAGNTQLMVRLVFRGAGGDFSTVAVTIPGLSGWSDVTFDIRPEALVSAGGSNAAATMAAVDTVRILHSPTPAWVPDPFAGMLRVDNIKAVPEPGTIAIAALAGAFAFVRKRVS